MVLPDFVFSSELPVLGWTILPCLLHPTDSSLGNCKDFCLCYQHVSGMISRLSVGGLELHRESCCVARSGVWQIQLPLGPLCISQGGGKGPTVTFISIFLYVLVHTYSPHPVLLLCDYIYDSFVVRTLMWSGGNWLKRSLRHIPHALFLSEINRIIWESSFDSVIILGWVKETSQWILPEGTEKANETFVCLWRHSSELPMKIAKNRITYFFLITIHLTRHFTQSFSHNL